MYLENDDDKMFDLMNVNVLQKSNLENQKNKLSNLFNLNQNPLPSSLNISNSVVNNKIGGNLFNSSSATNNGDIFGEIRNFKCGINFSFPSCSVSNESEIGKYFSALTYGRKRFLSAADVWLLNKISRVTLILLSLNSDITERKLSSLITPRIFRGKYILYDGNVKSKNCKAG